MTPGAGGQPSAGTGAPAWGRLNARLILVDVTMLATPVAMFLCSYLVTGGKVGPQALIPLVSLLGTFLFITGLSLMRLITTRYRVTNDRVELRSGLLFRNHRSIPVDRIRSVDLTAKPVHRVFKLTSLRIGTGEQSSSYSRKLLSLDGISVAHATELRRQLLERRDAGSTATAAEDDNGPISRMDWSWLRYAPLTAWGVSGVFIAVGTGYRTLREMGVDLLELGVVKGIEGRFGSVPLWFGILAALLIVVLLGAAVSTATFVEAWSGYRLEREGDGTFRIRRGLLVTRSVTIEERRLRGVEVSEPMLLRWAGGARLNAIASGLDDRDENRGSRSLTPPVPLPEALRVAADVLSEERSPTILTELDPHPRAALRRRISRGLSVVALIVVTLLGLGLRFTPVLVHAAWVSALVLPPVALALAHDAYRTLGHGIRGRYLVTRAGTFTHRTAALQRDGIIGWNISRSPFQRRSGLLTLSATTAAGDGRYQVRDVSVSHGLAFAEEAVPRLLTPFLERESGNR